MDTNDITRPGFATRSAGEISSLEVREAALERGIAEVEEATKVPPPDEIASLINKFESAAEHADMLHSAVVRQFLTDGAAALERQAREVERLTAAKRVLEEWTERQGRGPQAERDAAKDQLDKANALVERYKDEPGAAVDLFREWIYHPERFPNKPSPPNNTVLTAIPTMTATAVPAAATAFSALPAQPENDPVFEAIEEYKRADREKYEAWAEHDHACADLLTDENFPHPVFSPETTEDERSKAWDEWWDRTGIHETDVADRYEAARDAFEAAVEALIETRPTTLAGAAALLALWHETHPLESGSLRWHEPVLENLVETIKRMADPEARS